MGSISYTHRPLGPTGQGAPGRLPRPSLPIRLSIYRQESDTPTPSLERLRGPGPLHGEHPWFSDNLINVEETENTIWEERCEVADRRTQFSGCFLFQRSVFLHQSSLLCFHIYYTVEVSLHGSSDPFTSGHLPALGRFFRGHSFYRALILQSKFCSCFIKRFHVSCLLVNKECYHSQRYWRSLLFLY